MPDPAIILLSGGLDSATTLAIAREQGYACHALSFDYGQRHRFELAAARRVAEHLGAAEHLVMTIDLRLFGGSALTAEIDVPKQSATSPQVHKSTGPQVHKSTGPQVHKATGPQVHKATGPQVHRSAIPVTYVPARNTIFLSFALGLAEVRGATDIFIGVSSIDYSGYPDCRPAFIDAFERMANLATKVGVEHARSAEPPIRIHAPLIKMSKAQTIQRGLELGVDYGLTHSCYDPDLRTGRPCGSCESCSLRAAGFQEAGVPDPLSQRPDEG